MGFLGDAILFLILLDVVYFSIKYLDKILREDEQKRKKTFVNQTPSPWGYGKHAIYVNFNETRNNAIEETKKYYEEKGIIPKIRDTVDICDKDNGHRLYTIMYTPAEGGKWEEIGEEPPRSILYTICPYAVSSCPYNRATPTTISDEFFNTEITAQNCNKMNRNFRIYETENFGENNEICSDRVQE